MGNKNEIYYNECPTLYIKFNGNPMLALCPPAYQNLLWYLLKGQTYVVREINANLICPPNAIYWSHCWHSYDAVVIALFYFVCPACFLSQPLIIVGQIIL